MSEIILSERAEQVFKKLGDFTPNPIWIRQQTLAEHFNCSRRTIGRVLKELKAANLLVDLNRRHENRCKVYRLEPDNINPSLTPQGEQQLKLYRQTFEITFREWPDWIKYYPQVTRELVNETDIHLLWRETFDRLYVIRDRGGKNPTYELARSPETG